MRRPSDKPVSGALKQLLIYCCSPILIAKLEIPDEEVLDWYFFEKNRLISNGLYYLVSCRNISGLCSHSFVDSGEILLSLQKLKQDHFTGADTVQYSLISRKELLIEGSPVTILNVRLECDIELTPWCMTVDQLEKYLKDLEKIDHDRVEYLKLKLFGPNGLMITPTKQPKTAHKNHT